MKTIGKRDMETHDVHQVTAVAMVQARKLLFLGETVSTSRRIWKEDSVDRSCYAEADVRDPEDVCVAYTRLFQDEKRV
ncbi:hypothetical protein HBI26_042610 [Parastagonospora nodorum]|nr:hypothetical protein HBH42_110470 [Parastagonospora nodorum]KAH5074766.1 hypothetical protein HBH95_136000 [Parastagonospora nodorum]KAH5160622.1 hypothetical protein HBH69_040470 [Parastagonospora nodorum]KAH5607061.1 hypothetical protein HBI26_042610 [Parastagonospora nodorum]KAH6425894.1 hypothetical protein HBI14_061680 [Parastagonospora nodorum]